MNNEGGIVPGIRGYLLFVASLRKGAKSQTRISGRGRYASSDVECYRTDKFFPVEKDLSIMGIK